MAKIKIALVGLAAAVSAVAVRFAHAEEVSADSAGIAAQRWLQDDAALGCPLGAEVDGIRTCFPQADASFHVVTLKGGGFVVMSSDTTREPVVAFSSGGDLVESDSNPLWVLLKNDLALRAGDCAGDGGTKGGMLKVSAGGSAGSENEAKWNRLLGKADGMLRAAQGVSSISDIRVAPLVQSKWDQGNVGSANCYNYYTPNYYVCGCVATAGAQIMRYFQWPRSSVSVAQYTNPYCKVDGASRTLTTQGGTCNWSQMPLVPSSSISTAQRQAIGKLTSDIGICVGMSYASGGSSSGGYMLAEVFTNHYKYANALAAQWSGDVSSSDDMKNAILSNFDAGLPVALGLSHSVTHSGHEIVGDGYGYSSGTLYLHFNMGWSGTDNAWYAPPRMSSTQYDFNVLDGFVCNVFTNSALKGGVICSGRVLDASGAPIANAVVSIRKGSGSTLKSATTNAKGIYALVLTGVPKSATSYTLTATSGGSSATKGVSLKANVGTQIIASGQYFGQYYQSTVTIGNRCGQDITITGVAGVSEPKFNPSSCMFYPSTNVTLTCATAGATIRYTLDGTDPTESSLAYSGPIFVDDTVTIKARAWKSGMNPSAVVGETYTYDSSQGAPKGDYFADPINISGESGSRDIDDNTAYTVETGEKNHTGYYQYRTVWYKWTAPGSGTMTFSTALQWWTGAVGLAAYTGNSLSSLSKLTSSIDADGSGSATITIDVKQGVTYYVVGMTLNDQCTGKFTLTWSGNLTVAQTATSTTPVPVPYTWLDAAYPGQGTNAAAYETLGFSDTDGDGFTAWEEYLLDTNPKDPSSRLYATVRLVNGSPVFGWSHTNANISAQGYRYVPKGRTALDDAAGWQPYSSGHRFFKVTVEPAD